MKRDLILALGYGGRVDELVKGGAMPAAIVQDLENDSVFMERMQAFGATKLHPGDIYRYLAKSLGDAQSIISKTTGGSPEDATTAIQAAKERIMANLAIFASFEPLAQRAVRILEEDLDRYEMGRQIADTHNRDLAWDSKQRMPAPSFPHQTYETTRKGIVTLLEGIRTLRGDAQLQGMVRAQTINVNRGISTDELHGLLFDVGAELGFTRSQVLEAYGKVIMRRKVKKTIDAEPMPNEGKWEGRMPIIKAVEERLGIGASSE